MKLTLVQLGQLQEVMGFLACIKRESQQSGPASAERIHIRSIDAIAKLNAFMNENSKHR